MRSFAAKTRRFVATGAQQALIEAEKAAAKANQDLAAAQKKGDRQAEKEMTVFAKRLEKLGKKPG